MPELALHGLPTAEVRTVAGGSAKFDLEFFLRSDDGTALGATVIFAADLFDEVTVRRMAEVLGRVLGQVLEAPEVRLSRLETLSSGERELLTGSWAGSVAEAGSCRWCGGSRRRWPRGRIGSRWSTVTGRCRMPN
ncbi:condensation domain-containing protein [Streptomyces zhihengii]